MAGIQPHSDGQVAVPDEPVSFRPGERVVIRPVGEPEAGTLRSMDVTSLRKLDIHLDVHSIREIVDGSELSLENL